MAERVVVAAGRETDAVLKEFAKKGYWVLVAVVPVTKHGIGMPREYRELYFERERMESK